MITGRVNDKRIPTIQLNIGNRQFQAIIDTGFNFDLELPYVTFPDVNAKYKGNMFFSLGADQSVKEDVYNVTLEFDGVLIHATATFVNSNDILIGTRMLRGHRLTIDFPSGKVALKRTKLR